MAPLSMLEKCIDIDNKLWHTKIGLTDGAFNSLSCKWMFSLNRPLISLRLRKNCNNQSIKGEYKRAANVLDECLFTCFFKAKSLLRQKLTKNKPPSKNMTALHLRHAQTHSALLCSSLFTSLSSLK